MDAGRLAFDGIFCVTDTLAVHIRAMLVELGLRVPEDVQIIGFDGVRRFAAGKIFCAEFPSCFCFTLTLHPVCDMLIVRDSDSPSNGMIRPQSIPRPVR